MNLKAVALLAVTLSFLIPTTHAIGMGQVNTTEEDKYLNEALAYIMANRTNGVRIQLIDDATGQPVSNDVEYVQTTHDFIFGSGGVGIGYSPPALLTLREQLGADWAPLTLFWEQIEPVRGAFNFRSADSARNNALTLGRSQLFVELRVYPEPGPSWVPPPWTNWQDLKTNSSLFSDYKQYVYEFVFAAAYHFRDSAKVWSTQLEYNLRRCDCPKYAVPFTIEQSLELTRIQAKAIRDAIPDATILLGTSDPVGYWEPEQAIDPVDFTRMAISYGIDFNGVYIQFFSYTGTPASLFQYLKKFQSLGKSAYVGEIKYDAAPPTVQLPKGPGWRVYDEKTQGLWANYTITYAFALGLGYNWFPFYDQSDPNYPLSQNKGGLVDVQGRPRQAYFVYRDLIRQFTTNGTAVSDMAGVVAFKGFAGIYTIFAEGFQPVLIHVRDGAENTFALRIKRIQSTTSTTMQNTILQTTQTSPLRPLFWFWNSDAWSVLLVVLLVILGAGAFSVKKLTRRNQKK